MCRSQLCKQMFAERPMRVVRQKTVRTGGVVGVHPSEEAAIRKALRASLQVRKNLSVGATQDADPLLSVPNLCQVAPPMLDFIPNSLQSSNYPLPGAVTSACLLSVTCVSTGSREQGTPSSCAAVQTGQNCCPVKKVESKNYKSKGHKVREQSSTLDSSESVFVQHKSSRTFMAQRKFTQNFGPVPIQKVFAQASSPSSSDIPKTEDFISFLCLRDEPLLLC